MKQTKESILNFQSEYLLNTYGASLILRRGEGPYVWDIDEKRYFDFTCGISVCNLGHCHPKVTKAMQDQAATLVHVSNLYVNELQPQLAKQLSEKSYDAKVFFCNSGAEANEGLIKFARKWGADQGRYEVISMKHSFHGRTIATLSATDKPAIKKGFGPFPDGFKIVEFNDLAEIDEAITEKTAAILMEPVQGEGGLFPADPEYLKGLREICNKHEILLMFDEVQTGIGRTGTLFGFQQYDVIPDALSLAKGLGNGVPIGAIMIHPKWAEVMGRGSHATTFGGNPLVSAAALAVLDTIEEDNLLDNVNAMGDHLKSGLDQLVEKHELVLESRGLGLMRGIKVQDKQADIIQAAQTAGLLLVPAGDNVIRIYPPLNVTVACLDEALTILDNVLGEFS